MSLPVGTYIGTKIDANGSAFFKSVGSPDALAELWGGNVTNVTITKTGINKYNVHLVEPARNMSQDFAFKLDVEEVNSPPCGVSVKSTFRWNEARRTLNCQFNNSKGVSWTVDWYFDGNHLTLERRSPTVTSVAEFQKI